MNFVPIGEAVKVRADFTGGQITPLKFKRDGNVHAVKEVCARWQDIVGR